MFDPIRELSVQGKVMNWFDYKGRFPIVPLLAIRVCAITKLLKDYAIYKWLRENTYDRIAFTFSSKRAEEADEPAIWKERKDAKATLRAYLNDLPCELQDPVKLNTCSHEAYFASYGCGYPRPSRGW